MRTMLLASAIMALLTVSAPAHIDVVSFGVKMTEKQRDQLSDAVEDFRLACINRILRDGLVHPDVDPETNCLGRHLAAYERIYHLPHHVVVADFN